MTGGGTDPIDVRLLRTIDAPVGLVRGQPGVQWSSGGQRVVAPTAERFEVYDRAALLAGRVEAVQCLPRPALDTAAVTPDGATVVVAGQRAVRAVAPDGSTRWELAHDPWHGDRIPGPPAVSPDGRQVAVVIPVRQTDPAEPPVLTYDGERGGYVSDRWLLLDAGTGDVLARERIRAISTKVTQRWHADGRYLVLSCATDWWSWSTYRIEIRPGAVAVRPCLPWREVTDLLDATRVLSVRRAEYTAGPDDDQTDVAVHRFPGGDRLALLDHTALGLDLGFDELRDARQLDDDRIMVSAEIAGATTTARHWLCHAATLQPLGHLRYPTRVSSALAPLPDGTWLTEDGTWTTAGTRLQHWALAGN